MRNAKKLLFILGLLIPSIVTPGLYTEGGLRYDVVVIEWEPFYVYPQIPALVDHRPSDVYEISMWQKYTSYTPPYALREGDYTLGEWIPFQQHLACGDCTYGQSTWKRSEEFIYDGITYKEKWGDQWAMFLVWGGYIGVLPVTVKWVAENQRTGQSWEVFRLAQTGYIDCTNAAVDGRCVGVPDDSEPLPLMPPLPPTMTVTGVPVLVDRTGWTVAVNNTENSTSTKAELYHKDHAIDEDVTTIWHTRWVDPPVPMPHWIIVDMKEEHKVSSMVITPRPYDPAKAHTVNSNVKDYKISVSMDNTTWQLVREGTLAFTEGAPQEVPFTPTNARYIKLDILSASGDTPAVCLGDLKFTEIR